MNKGRLEALTDGIVAIAATIMVLELSLPTENTWAGLMAQRHVILAYVISFFMIYTVWYSHHNLFQHAKVISPMSFFANGVWIFFLTLVPFTTSWLGSAPDSLVPEILYAVVLLLWSISFQFLDHCIRKDNPDVTKDSTLRLLDRIILYAGYTICIVVSLIKPIGSMYLMAAITVLSMIRLFIARRRKSAQPDKSDK